MGKIVEGYFHLLKFLIVLCMALMVILVFGNVVLRYGFNTGITISEELSRWFFVYVTFLGAIVAMREHAHLGVDSLVRRLSPSGKKVCFIVSQLLMLFATWLFLQGSWALLGNYGPAILLILLGDLYRVVSGKASEQDLVMVKDSEEQEQLEELQKELARHNRDEREVPPKSG